MKRRTIAVGAACVLVGVPILLISALYAFFYAVFYFPNRSEAVAGSLVSSGENREYLLYVPKRYDRAKPAPLVITLHTSMSWPSAAMNISHWNQVADEQGVVMVYPAASGTGNGPRSWEMKGIETPSRMPDVIFISDLIDTLEKAYNIDSTRIYVNGMSNGGGMTFVLSCTLLDRVAAVGMVSAGLDPDWNWCSRPMPVIAFHGTADPICPYDGGPAKLGGGTFAGIRGFMAQWSRRNRCRANPIETSVAADVTRLEYPDCADDAGVVLYSVKGEGHQWPGGEPIAAQWLVGPYSDGIDATRQMWAFFSRHRLPGG